MVVSLGPPSRRPHELTLDLRVTETSISALPVPKWRNLKLYSEDSADFMADHVRGRNIQFSQAEVTTEVNNAESVATAAKYGFVGCNAGCIN